MKASAKYEESHEAVIYARVSSKEQEREGFSIPAQLKFLRAYAASNGLAVLKEFTDVETAKATGRKEFGTMVNFIKRNPGCKIIVEKTDRLYRNFRDRITLEDLGVEIHFAKENEVLNKDSKSQTKFMQNIRLSVATQFIDNLREEVQKGMREKAEQGIFPSRPPLGYRNDRLNRTIELDPDAMPRAKRMFELYASGISLSAVRTQMMTEFGVRMGKSHIEKLLKNPFYVGTFIWQGVRYKGTHELFIDCALFDQAQAAFARHNKPKYRKHDFAYAGLLTCGYDQCTVTAEIKKGKYIYYRCTGHRGKCELPYFRQEEIGRRLAPILENIHIPDDVMPELLEYLRTRHSTAKQKIEEQRQRLDIRRKDLHKKLEQMYVDKLDGKIPEELWMRLQPKWQQELRDVDNAVEGLSANSNREFVPTASRILELANKACFLYLTQPDEERAKLLKMVVSNCSIDAVSVRPTYRKPFAMIAERAKTKEWYAREDSNL